MKRSIAIFLLLAVLLAGCGSDDPYIPSGDGLTWDEDYTGPIATRLADEEVQERVDALRQKMPDVTYKEDFVRRMREQSKLLPELNTADKDDWFD